jgi:hypothetical protein
MTELTNDYQQQRNKSNQMNSFIIGQAHFYFRKTPAELDELIYMQPNGIITRNT